MFPAQKNDRLTNFAIFEHCEDIFEVWHHMNHYSRSSQEYMFQNDLFTRSISSVSHFFHKPMNTELFQFEWTIKHRISIQDSTQLVSWKLVDIVPQIHAQIWIEKFIYSIWNYWLNTSLFQRKKLLNCITRPWNWIKSPRHLSVLHRFLSHSARALIFFKSCLASFNATSAIKKVPNPNVTKALTIMKAYDATMYWKRTVIK